METEDDNVGAVEQPREGFIPCYRESEVWDMSVRPLVELVSEKRAGVLHPEPTTGAAVA